MPRLDLYIDAGEPYSKAESVICGPRGAPVNFAGATGTIAVHVVPGDGNPIATAPLAFDLDGNVLVQFTAVQTAAMAAASPVLSHEMVIVFMGGHERSIKGRVFMSDQANP